MPTDMIKFAYTVFSVMVLVFVASILSLSTWVLDHTDIRLAGVMAIGVWTIVIGSLVFSAYMIMVTFNYTNDRLKNSTRTNWVKLLARLVLLLAGLLIVGTCAGLTLAVLIELFYEHWTPYQAFPLVIVCMAWGPIVWLLFGSKVDLLTAFNDGVPFN